MKIDKQQNYWGWYTLPTLINRKNNLKKSWMVQFYFSEDEAIEPRSLPPIQVKRGINYLHTIKQRTQAGNALREVLTEWLQNDWHPRADKYPELADKKLLPHEQWQQKRVCDALAEVFSNKKLAANSKKDYRLAIDYFEEAMTALDMQDTKLMDLKKSTILMVMDAYKEIRSASDKQYNKNLGYLKSLIATACEYAEIYVSPAFKIKELKVCEGDGFTPPTDEEQRMIREHLSLYHPNFYVLNLVIYHTGIRTNEALALRISDIDFAKKRFVIIAESERNNAKTKRNRLVPIVDELWEHLEKMDLSKFPGDYYLFGSPATSGRGWTGVRHSATYYTPHPVRAKRDTATRLWKTIVKDGLGFDCDMYGLKHKGAQDKNDAGMSTDAVMQLFGHASKRMTRKYQGELPYEKEIRMKSPTF